MERVNNLRLKFLDLFNNEPRIFRAPGRINLIGEHTDYNDGFVMPAAIDKQMVFAIAESRDEKSTVYSLDMNESYVINLDELQIDSKVSWVNYLVGVIAALKEKGYTIRPFNCVFGGDIPVGSGLSSSAAVECGFIVGLNAIFQLKLSGVEMAKMAQWAEHHYAGVKCGIMDQFSSMMGKAGHVFRLDCRTMQQEYFPLDLKEYALILLDTNVKHSLAGSEYNTRRRECEQGVSILRNHYPTIINLRDVSSDRVKKHKNELPEKVYDRCLYVTQEIERVLLASEDLQKGDLGAFGKKMFETHKGLSALYEVSCAELDFLVDELKDNPDVLGARMMGGGFGGCTINIIRESAVDSIVRDAAEKYKKTFQRDLKIYPVKIRDGAGELLLNE